jgi:hypothetical protein
MPVGDQDVAANTFFRDCSRVKVVESGLTFDGFFLYPEVITEFPPLNAMAGDVAGKPTLQYATELAPRIGRGTLLEIECEGSWEVRNVELQQDGKVSLARLKRP